MLEDEEKLAAQAVLNGHVLVHGPRIHEFENAFAAWTGADRAVALSSCTAGLHLAYFCRGIGPGDEVIVPAMTHVATAHAVELVGAKPVFVDAEPATGNLDPSLVEEAITPATKALSLVHYLGAPADMDALTAIAKKHDLFVVEDCALAIGARHKGVHVGLIGDIGLFSFYPVKHMTTLEGGMALSNHPQVLDDLALQRAFGVDRTHAERKVPGQYDVTHLGFNYRMNELQAAIGTEQVSRLDGFLQERDSNHATLTELLSEEAEIDLFAPSGPEYQSAHYCFSFILNGPLAERRPAFIESLKQKGVGTSIYYPRPVPELTYYKNKYGFRNDQFPVASRIAHQSIALPVGPHLNQGDAEYAAKAVIATIRELS